MFDAGPHWTPVAKNTNSADATAGIDITDAPGANKTLVCDDLLVSVGSTAMTLTITEETSGTVLAGPWYLPANFFGQVTLRNGNFRTLTANKKARATASAAGNVTIQFSGHTLG